MTSTGMFARVRWKLAVILLVAATMASLGVAHAHGLNGPWYWMWPWRRLGWQIYPALLAASTPLFVALWLRDRFGVKPARLVPLLMLATLCLELAAISLQPLGLNRISAIVENSVNTSYYNAAKVLTEQMDAGKSYSDWLVLYPQLMPKLMLHAGYKPPGLIFCYIAIIRIFGAGPAATMAGGLLVALLAASSVAATFVFIRFFSGDENAAFHGAAFFSLTPSLVLFLPQADQAYPILSCFLLIAWAVALRKRLYAIAFGVLLALLLFITPTFLMLGMFLATYTIFYLGDHGTAGWARVIERGILALLVILVLYATFFSLTGYAPITTFLVAAERSQSHLVELQRPWPLHSLLDFVDIALGTGWISVPLIVMGAMTAWRDGGWRGRSFRLVFLGLLQVFAAVAVALFPGENARLMLPLMPLLMAPIGFELTTWTPRARVVVYLALVLVVAVICQNMIFLYMGPEIDGVPRVS